MFVSYDNMCDLRGISVHFLSGKENNAVRFVICDLSSSQNIYWDPQ